jgi:hypothetical protein
MKRLVRLGSTALTMSRGKHLAISAIQLVNARTQYASSSLAAIGRNCRNWENHAQNFQLTSPFKLPASYFNCRVATHETKPRPEVASIRRIHRNEKDHRFRTQRGNKGQRGVFEHSSTQIIEAANQLVARNPARAQA